MVDIILTADRTTMNNFHLKRDIATPFYGNGDLFPRWLFNILIRNPKHNDGIPIYAPYPLRKVEAKCLDLGYNVKIISPNYLSRYLDNAKVLGIHTVNPFGVSFFPYFNHYLTNAREDYSVKYFKKILLNKSVKNAKKNGLKIIIGGAGSSQFIKKPEMIEQFDIDCVIFGESELIIQHIIESSINGKKIPPIINTMDNGSIPAIDDIPEIKFPSIFGCIEIGRGCTRGCKFCDMTGFPVRWMPIDLIEKELQVNNRAGLNYGLIHAEDVLLYGQNGVIPSEEKLNKLFRTIKQYYEKVHITHLSIAAVAASPKTFQNLMELICENQDFMGGETGLETGSPQLLNRTMPAKAKPFHPFEWNEIVNKSLGLMVDNNMIPVCSLIVGNPEETSNDLILTINLIEDLKQYKTLLFPVNFTPLGNFMSKDYQSRKIEDLDALQKELVQKCIAHNLHWFDNFISTILNGKKSKPVYKFLFKLWIKQFVINAKLDKSSDLHI